MSDLLNKEIKNQVRQVFADLKEPVKVLFFGSNNGCAYCGDTQQLAQEVVSLDDKLSMDVYDLGSHADVAAQYNVDKAPSLVIAASNSHGIKDYGIRYAGIPSGHEFKSLIHDLLRVSKRDSELSQAARDFLKSLTSPVHLQIFVTPT